MIICALHDYVRAPITLHLQQLLINQNVTEYIYMSMYLAPHADFLHVFIKY